MALGTSRDPLLFINHRRSDTGFVATRLYAALTERIAQEQIFLDQETIGYGERWPERLQLQVDNTSVFLALIGKNWLHARNEASGRRRLDEADDWVRSEIAEALRREDDGALTLVPVLVDGAQMPAADHLPEAIRDLATRQALELRSPTRDWESDIAEMTKLLDIHGFRAAEREGTGDTPGIHRAVGATLGLSEEDLFVTIVDHLKSRLRRVNVAEDDWRDSQYAELQADVQERADPVRSGIGRFIRNFPLARRIVRAEESVSEAILDTPEPVILLEGEPGSGKSVTLRHIAESRLSLARASGDVGTVLPLYVNLRELDVGDNVTAEAILEFALHYALAGDPPQAFVNDFTAEFHRRVANGGWLVLLDSFDEIHELLGESEPNALILKYANAIDGLARLLNRARVVVASRPYRSPKRIGWPFVEIVPLSESRQRRLVELWFRDVKAADKIYLELAAADRLREYMDNPLFLSLMCEFRSRRGAIPESAHEAFEGFVEHRLERDRSKLAGRGLSGTDLRANAEIVAYAMTADRSLGLAPQRRQIRASPYLTLDAATLSGTLDALEMTHLADEPEAAAHPTFSFLHRRLQEYFATCFVLEHPDRVAPEDLLMNGRWRETAITLLQASGAGQSTGVLTVAEQVTQTWFTSEPDTSLNPLGSVGLGREREPYDWPERSLHVLGILAQRPREAQFSAVGVDRLLRAAISTGLQSDRREALAVAGAASPAVFPELLTWGFRTGSRLLGDACYQSARMLDRVSDQVADGMREWLVWLAVTGTLRKDPTMTEAHVRRVSTNPPLLDSLRLLQRIRRVDIGLLILGMLVLAQAGSVGAWEWLVVVPIAAFVALILAALTPAMLRQMSTTGAFAKQPPAKARRGDPWQARFTLDLVRWGSWVYLSLVLRFILLGAFAWLLTEALGARPTDVPGPAVVLIALLFGWVFGAYLAARYGLMVSRVWWPVLSLWPAIRFMLFVVERPLRALLGALVVTGLASAIVVATALMSSLSEDTVNVAFPLTWVGVGLLLGAQTLWLVRAWALDRRVLAEVRSGQTLTALRFIELSGRFRLQRYRVSTARWLADEHRLDVDADGPDLLSNLEHAIERDYERILAGAWWRKRIDMDPHTEWHEEFTNWYEQRPRKSRSGLSAWHGEYLDEVSRLVHQSKQAAAAAEASP